MARVLVNRSGLAALLLGGLLALGPAGGSRAAALAGSTNAASGPDRHAAGPIQGLDHARDPGSVKRHLRVAIIVGPVGVLSDEYRAYADEAAAAAALLADDVVTVYTPDATWPAARAALDGASVVLYLGHGNGSPNRSRPGLRPSTQDGMGLNPVAGGGDAAHQYFGEDYLRRQVHLARGAVVVLGHLCYASGAGEPGMDQPPLDVAVTRVDNFGAGWLAAGAAAVIAEAHGSPAWYMHALLGGSASLESVWRADPSFHAHVQEFASARTPGARVLLDPDRPDTGFYRSIVLAPGTGDGRPPADGGVPDGPGGGPVAAAAPVPTWSSPVGVGLPEPVVAATTVTETLRFAAADRAALPRTLMIGTRWDPIVLDAGPPLPPGPVPASPGTIDLVAAETPGTLVVMAVAAGAGATRSVRVITPDLPGVYRLVTTLHGSDGVAFDAAAQARVRDLVVRVTAPRSAVFGVPPAQVVEPGAAVAMGVLVANTGTVAWSVRAPDDPGPAGIDRRVRSPRLVAHWLALTTVGASAPAVPPDVVVSADIALGTAALLVLPLLAPSTGGTWLLVLDVVTGDGRSLAAEGVPVGLVTILVAAPAAPSSRPRGLDGAGA
ncbi:MAG: hypothetical protein WCK58_02505 [Chloroflexota bacterium]